MDPDFMDLPDEFFRRLTRLRGGCRCSDPDAHPPCWACTSEMTDAEANEILSGFAEELPMKEVLRMQTILIENDYDGTIEV